MDKIATWETRSSTGAHFGLLDGVRGVAILMVVAYHTFYVNPNGGAVTRFIGDLIGMGWSGVPMFFVLSGFLISYPFFRAKASGTGNEFRSYTARRLAKIVPPYYLSILIFVLLYWLRFGGGEHLRSGVAWAVGLSNFIKNTTPFNGAYWSLLVEVQFYITLPLVFYLTRNLDFKRTVGWLFFFMLVVPLCARQLSWPSDYVLAVSKVSSAQTIAFFTQRFPGQFDYFAWGILFAGFFVSVPPALKRKRIHYLGYIGIVLFVGSMVLGALWNGRLGMSAHPARWTTEVLHVLQGGAMFLILFLVFEPRCLTSRIFSMTWLRFIGVVSYEWFLFHQPIVQWFGGIVGNTNGNLFKYGIKTLTPLAITFIFSVLLYRYFSLPIMIRVRTTHTPRKMVAGSAVVSVSM